MAVSCFYLVQLLYAVTKLDHTELRVRRRAEWECRALNNDSCLGKSTEEDKVEREWQGERKREEREGQRERQREEIQKVPSNE